MNLKGEIRLPTGDKKLKAERDLSAKISALKEIWFSVCDILPLQNLERSLYWLTMALIHETG